MRTTVEFVGGPWDGRVMAVSADHPREIRIALMNLMSPMASAKEFPEPESPVCRQGIYVRSRHTRFGDPWRYDWLGEIER